MRATLIAWFVLLGLGACTVEGLALTGKACPCAEGLECDPSSNLCYPAGVLDFSVVEPDLSPKTDSTLASLTVSRGVLSPAFSPWIYDYAVEVPLPIESVTVTANTAAADAFLLFDGLPAASGTASAPIDLTGAVRQLSISVNAAAGYTQTYHVLLRRSHYLKPSMAHTTSSTFGGGVAVSGDTLVVAAPQEIACSPVANGNPVCPPPGAAYVFIRSAGAWTQQAYLAAPNGVTRGNYGAVAIDGDTIAVAAPAEDSCAVGINGDPTSTGCQNTGAVYVFTRSGTTWTQEAYIKASRALADQGFGSALALEGEFLAVGAAGDPACTSAGADAGCLAAGAVYLFARSGKTWTQQSYLKAATPVAVAQFGSAVSLRGDTVAIGASAHTGCATGIGAAEAAGTCASAGAVSVFTRTAGVWSQQQFFKPDVIDATHYGASVALDGNTLVVGGTGYSDQGGKVYVYKGAGSSWTADGLLHAPTLQAFDRFGTSVRIAGARVVVGARSAFGGRGAAYLFERGSTSWQPIATVMASNAEPGDEAGGAVAMSNGWVLVGAPGEASAATGVDGDQGNNSLVRAGAAYVYAWP